MNKSLRFVLSFCFTTIMQIFLKRTSRSIAGQVCHCSPRLAISWHYLWAQVHASLCQCWLVLLFLICAHPWKQTPLTLATVGRFSGTKPAIVGFSKTDRRKKHAKKTPKSSPHCEHWIVLQIPLGMARSLFSCRALQVVLEHGLRLPQRLVQVSRCRNGGNNLTEAYSCLLD